MHAVEMPHAHTFWWQVIQHLSSKCLHIWNTVGVYGLFAVHPQNSHISITHQVLKQNFLCILIIGILIFVTRSSVITFLHFIQSRFEEHVQRLNDAQHQ